ncbi:hypothetical protein FOZ63_008952 [Perkinsus olseni]|uniref:Uncharacterized protein n=1 Tax=Perkinsus olseni TaxID=32597 RepID=A0A7J6TZA3_PEROL|nr:hypothetical protein FOZ63_008952 [Perkinsus olseni]
MRVYSVNIALAVTLQQATGANPSKKARLSPTSDVVRQKSCTLTTDDFQEEQELMTMYYPRQNASYWPHWASVSAKYDEESDSYFVDHVSVEATLILLPQFYLSRGIFHFLSPGELPFENAANYTLGSDSDCEESIINGAKHMLFKLVQNPLSGPQDCVACYQRLSTKMTRSPRTLSPLIIFHYIWKHSKKNSRTPAELSVRDYPNLWNEEILRVQLGMTWSRVRNHAFLSNVIVSYSSKRSCRLLLSEEGMSLLRSAWRKVSLSSLERMQKNASAMMVDVARELLNNHDVRGRAGVPGWNLIADEYDSVNVTVPFAEMLISAVALGWDQELQPFRPRRSMRDYMHRELIQRPLPPANTAGAA